MAIKEHKRQVRQTIEGLEFRLHRGLPIRGTELQVVRDFLSHNDFSPSSDYYLRLAQIQERLYARVKPFALPVRKGNYGGESAGHYLQVQSVFDHVILSKCYEGDFNTRHGRVKISHRFNQEGRIDFVELKFLRSLEPCLTGAFRKLLQLRDYQSNRKDWLEAEAFVLPVLPQELVFLYPDLFRSPRAELLAWLINIGHGVATDLIEDLDSRSAAVANYRSWTTAPAQPVPRHPNYSQCSQPYAAIDVRGTHTQISLSEIVRDEVAWPILKKVASLTSIVEINDSRTATVRYSNKPF